MHGPRALRDDRNKTLEQGLVSPERDPAGITTPDALSCRLI